MSKLPAIIVDLDGTLTSCHHRRHFVTGKKKDWKNFNFNIPYDACVEWIRDIVLEAAYFGVKTLFTSGRSYDFHVESAEWLVRNGILVPSTLIMRSSGDFRKDDIVKAELYEKFIEPFYDVQFVIDDRWSVIQMWESKGLWVLRVTDPQLEPNI